MKSVKLTLLIAALFIVATHLPAATIRVLFDATKAETAGNADWVIDSDGSPQQIPTPAQSGITSTTAETFWKGGISSWGIDCVKQGYYVETLPSSGKITYGLSSNLQDLSRYSVFVVCEPNTQFTAAEKTAIINFVQNGGGLFMVSDHNQSDRNSDGWDSPAIWNDLMSTNTVKTNPFGITFDLVSFSQTTSNIASLPTDSVLHGPFGNVAQAMWAVGTSMTLSKTANPSVVGQIFKTGSSTTGTTNVMFATARFGKGKVAAIGDSSPCDDGTGDTGDTLYDGYIADANGNHQKLLMNATIWLATPSIATGIADIEERKSRLVIAPSVVTNGTLHINYSLTAPTNNRLQLIDATGKVVLSKTISAENTADSDETISVSSLAGGIYLCKLTSGSAVSTKTFIIRNR